MQENSLLTVLRSPFRFKMFLLTRLPMAFLAGLKMEEIDETKAVVSLRYRFLTQNPFGSLYFACMAMAGELASGALSLLQVHGKNPPVSMLVVKLEAEFTKKAMGKIRFTCTDGAMIRKAIEECRKTGEARTLIATSTGVDEKGEQVAVFRVMWSYKVRSTKYDVRSQ